MDDEFIKHAEQCLEFTKGVFKDWKYLIQTESWKEGVIDYYLKKNETEQT